MSSKHIGKPLASMWREQVRELESERGTRSAAAALEISPATLARAIAGLPIARATATHIASRLSSVHDAGEIEVA